MGVQVSQLVKEISFPTGVQKFSEYWKSPSKDFPAEHTFLFHVTACL